MTEVPAPFGKYYLTEKLAAGGMAEIYLAKLLGPGGFEKHLVLKQIHPKLSGQRHFVDLFVAEAKILVGLVHGNIVPVYELGVIGDTYFIAMEYIDGPSLYRFTEQLRARGESMAPAVAAHIATKILDGLDYAHRKGDGIIHRDLSGRNVMISRDGEVKLVDFGIAVALGDPGDLAGDTPAGSFPYMSPEQVRREPLTGQSDLFSAGILLWEMLAGERLFARADAGATLRAVTEAELVPPSVRNPAVPGRLDEVVMKALQRDRALRWQTAADMLAALHRYLYSLEETPGARELGRLVARFCPPTARRRPTEADASPPPAALDGDGIHDVMGGGGGLGGPSTALLPRSPDGVRHQSFATHVELAGLLQGSDEELGNAVTAVVAREDLSSPLSTKPGEAATAEPSLSSSASGSSGSSETRATEGTLEGDLDRSGAGDAAASSTPMRAAAGEDVADSRANGVANGATNEAANDVANGAANEAGSAHRGRAGSRRRRVAVITSALVLAAAGVVTAAMLRSSATAPALPVEDSPSLAAGDPFPGDPLATAPSIVPAAADARLPDAARPADARRTPQPPQQPGDAGGPDLRRPDLRRPDARATPVDARPGPALQDARPIDARLSPAPVDARADARLLPRPDAPAPQPRGEPALIKVGANPWGEIFLDGKPAGRTPRTLSVAPGRHEIEVVFPVGETPRRETYRLDLTAGETRAVLADFTR